MKAIADRLAAEPGIAKVSVLERATPGYIRRFVRRNELSRLVVGGQDDEWIGEVSAGLFAEVKPQATAVRVVDLGRLCGPVHGRDEATAKALLLLLAAVARVRSPDTLAPAAVDDELRALLGRGDVGLAPRVPVLTCPAGLACLRMVGQVGIDYLPGALPLEVPCHLNMDRLLTARALELGAAAVLVMGCVPGCARGCQRSERQAESSNGQSLSRSTGEDQPLATVTVFGLSGLVEALDTCLGRV